MTDLRRTQTTRLDYRATMWILLITAASLVFSRAFACATPFAALATIAATRTPLREAMMAVGLAWLGNQATGFLLLHYPRTWDSVAWGAAIGLAALAATVVISFTRRIVAPEPVRIAIAFLAAFMAYEGSLALASLVLPSSSGAFAFPVIARILGINTVALIALTIVHVLATKVGFTPRTVLVTAGSD